MESNLPLFGNRMLEYSNRLRIRFQVILSSKAGKDLVLAYAFCPSSFRRFDDFLDGVKALEHAELRS